MVYAEYASDNAIVYVLQCTQLRSQAYVGTISRMRVSIFGGKQ